jgi:hypothetical protein
MSQDKIGCSRKHDKVLLMIHHRPLMKATHSSLGSPDAWADNVSSNRTTPWPSHTMTAMMQERSQMTEHPEHP